MMKFVSDLADTQKEKFAKLAEEIEYSTQKILRKSVRLLKESYFGQKKDQKMSL